MFPTCMIYSHLPDLRQHIHPQILFCNIGINLFLCIDSLFANVQLGNLRRTRQLYVRILYTIVNDLLIAVNLCTRRYMDMNHRPAFVHQQFRHKIDCRCKTGRITDHADKILHQILCCTGWNSAHRSIIQHTQKQISAKTVQKRTDTFIGIRFYSTSTSFKFYGYIFTDLQ